MSHTDRELTEQQIFDAFGLTDDERKFVHARAAAHTQARACIDAYRTELRNYMKTRSSSQTPCDLCTRPAVQHGLCEACILATIQNPPN